MRIVQFVHDSKKRGVGVIDGDDVVNLTASFPKYQTTLALALDAIEQEAGLAHRH